MNVTAGNSQHCGTGLRRQCLLPMSTQTINGTTAVVHTQAAIERNSQPCSGMAHSPSPPPSRLHKTPGAMTKPPDYQWGEWTMLCTSAGQCTRTFWVILHYCCRPCWFVVYQVFFLIMLGCCTASDTSWQLYSSFCEGTDYSHDVSVLAAD